jgi:hypothetical protein
MIVLMRNSYLVAVNIFNNHCKTNKYSLFDRRKVFCNMKSDKQNENIPWCEKMLKNNLKTFALQRRNLR